MSIDELVRAAVALVAKDGRYLAVVDASDTGLVRLRPRSKTGTATIDVSLHNDLVAINAGEMTIEKVLARFAATTLVGEKELAKLIELDTAKLVALVRHEAYLRAGNNRARIDAMARMQAGPDSTTSICAYDRLSGDLCVVLAQEGGRTLNTSIALQLRDAGLGYDEARAIAIKSTILRFSRIDVVKGHPSAQMIMVHERLAGSSEDTLSDCSTTLMLHKKFLKKLLKDYKGGIALAVPDRHTLLVTDAAKVRSISYLRSFAADWRRSADHPQSDQIHVWRGDAWELAR